MKQKNILSNSNILFLILFIISYVKSDLPVHCLVSDIQGDWVFRINTEKFDAKPEDLKTTCSHGLPPLIDKTVGDHDYSFDSTKDLELRLDEFYKVFEGGVEVGKWTPVYDQSFVIYYKNSILTAPYKYFKNEHGQDVSNCKKTMMGWLMPDANENTKNWSCFFSFKKGTIMSPARSFLQIESKVEKMNNQNNREQFSFAQLQKTYNLHNSLKYEHLNNVVEEINNAGLLWKAEVHDEFRGLSFIELKNKFGLTHKLQKFTGVENIDTKNFYKNTNSIQGPKGFNFIQVAIANEKSKSISKSESRLDNELKEFLEKLNSAEHLAETSNERLSTHEKASNKIKKQININLDSSSDDDLTITTTSTSPATPILPTPIIPNTDVNKRDSDSSFVTDHSEIIKYQNLPLDQIPEDKLPLNWDWRNVGGKNFVPSVKSQGNCGSCYLFSSLTCLEARLRIQTDNQDQTEFSKQYALSCNFYSEGCDGGYPFLVGKFFSEFELIPEECFKYTQSTGQCSNICDYKKIYNKEYKVSRYGYLGGHYGATNEALMLKELRANGPIPGNIRIPVTFNYYKNGIFSEESIKKNAGKLSKTTLVDRNLSWEKVEHSITIVGYGEEKGVKYWIGMNTWGANWGENGFFKILRGENDCSIESMGDFLQISFKSR